MTVVTGSIEFSTAEVALILATLALFVIVAFMAVLTVAGPTPLGLWWREESRRADAATPALSRRRKVWFVLNALAFFVATTLASPLVLVGVAAVFVAVLVALEIKLPRFVAWIMFLAPLTAVGVQVMNIVRVPDSFDLGPLAVWLVAMVAAFITAFQGVLLSARTRARREGLYGLEES